ncbi:MAG TPA: hypothetical protein VIH47_06925 [Solirubrobacterales bacterium]
MSERGRQWSAAMGAVGIVLVLGALFLPGSPPKTSDSVRHLTTVFVDKRRLFLVDTYLAALGALAFLWFLAPLYEFLARRGRNQGVATVAALGGAMAMLLVLVGVAITTGLVINATGMHDPAVVRAFADTTNVLIELSKFGLAALILATVAVAAQAGLLPRPMRAVGLAASALLIFSALPPLLFDSGILQFGGGVEVLAAAPAALWLVWLSLVIARSSPSDRA